MTVSMPFDARMLRSRGALRHALLGLLERETFDSIAIRDIAREAGVGAATFYRHYETKTDLLEDIATHEMEALIDVAVPVLKMTGSREAAIALCRYVESHRTLWSALFTGGAAGAMRIAFQSHLRQAQLGSEAQRSRIPQDLALSVGASGLIEVLSWWLADGKNYAAEQIAGFLDDLVIRPGSADMVIRAVPAVRAAPELTAKDDRKRSKRKRTRISS